MRFERGIDPKSALKIGLQEQIKKVVLEFTKGTSSPMSVTKIWEAQARIAISLEMELGFDNKFKVELKRPKGPQVEEYMGKTDWLVYVKYKVKGRRRPMLEKVPWFF